MNKETCEISECIENRCIFILFDLLENGDQYLESIVAVFSKILLLDL